MLRATTAVLRQFFSSFGEFLKFFFYYCKKKVLVWSFVFEQRKNILVRFFMMKRGRYNRPFLHIAAMIVLAIGVMVAPFLAETYPVFSEGTQESLKVVSLQGEQSVSVDDEVFETVESIKPRDKILTYGVAKGDTLSTIAEKFGISTDTIRWANNLSSDDLTIGEELKILPVSGIAHKVESGETVYSIAKKYDTEPQGIVDFPFNDFVNPETFTLIAGQMLIVPDGVKPNERPTTVRRQYIAAGPTQVFSSGFTWPVRGGISQFAAWYHMAIDITSDIGTPVVAAHSGTVVSTNAGTWDGGYGTNLMVDDGNGFQTLYAHMSGLNISVGSTVTAGKTIIGWVGMTGRTTGPHLHFEIRKNGAMVNPMAYLR